MLTWADLTGSETVERKGGKPRFVIDADLKREIEALTGEAMDELVITDSEHLELSDEDLARMNEAFYEDEG